MSERDELAAVIASTFRVHPNGVAYVDHKGGADALLAAGYRKPRTITTAEELDALPVGSVVLDPLGLSLHRDIIGWNCSNGSRHIDREEIESDAFPATVLYEPTA